MHDKMFFTAVAVTVGVGLKREIASLSQMHEFLTEFEPSRRRLSYGNAVRACEAARAGEASTQIARDALITFAANTGILWPEVARVISVRPSVHGFGGFAM